MNELEQRIAIALFCGAKWHWTDNRKRLFVSFKLWDGDVLSESEHLEALNIPRTVGDGIPDYFHDLNAMHEAEKLLVSPIDRTALWLQYNAALFKVATGVNLSRAVQIPRHIFSVITATAQQRAEALLKTINK